MALAGMTASVDISQPRDGALPSGRDNLIVVTAKAGKHPDMLPTPPNSISPNLPPHRRRDSRSIPDTGFSGGLVEEEDDNMGAPVKIEDHAVQGLSAEALDSLGDLDSAGAITPGLLAKHHLPDILLSHGPLAIRHIMGYLTTSVPGFSRITSAKARRLVVAALEGRGGSIDVPGTDGDVMFDKVGWGRWDARLRGQPPRERPSGNLTPPGSLPSNYSQPAMNIPGRRVSHNSSERFDGSGTATSAVFSRSDLDNEDHDVIDEEADRMSLDGNDDECASVSPPPEPLMDVDMPEGDETDEEDWASIGAAALRAQSLPKDKKLLAGGGYLYQPVSYMSSRPRTRTPASNLAQSVPLGSTSINTNKNYQLPAGVGGFDNSQERAAIEVLLSLGSM